MTLTLCGSSGILSGVGSFLNFNGISSFYPDFQISIEGGNILEVLYLFFLIDIMVVPSGCNLS